MFKKKRIFDDEEEKKSQTQEITSGQKDVETICQRRFEGEIIEKSKRINKEKSVEVERGEKQKKILSVAKRRFSKHISENSLLPKIHFHLEY